MFIIFFQESRPALRLKLPAVRFVPEVFFLGQSGRRVKVTTHHLVLSLIIGHSLLPPLSFAIMACNVTIYLCLYLD